VLRYFNPVGAHKSALIGELPIGTPQNLVPFITQSAIGKRGSITVYGNDYNTPDGSAIRDYIHVVDLAKAHVAAIKRLENNTENYEVFNVGTGKGSSVLEIINAFEAATGVKLNYKIGDRRSGDIEEIYGDVTLSNTTLDWKAELDLQEMMRSAWNWEKYLKENPF
jgi:UDP-glucose 4-epimerase